jgi:hypothetical protein
MKKIISILFLLAVINIANAQHTIILKSGEKMNGTVQSLKEGTISFLFKGNTMSFKVGDVSSIIFDSKAAPAEEHKSVTTDAGIKGVQYSMPGRKMVTPPKYENLTMRKGIVVCEITIDKYGHVMKAKEGAEGTTTTDAYLLTKGKQAAQSAEFDNCPKCPLETQGTITITF